jgi:membrane-bound lytic murein transglycosylase D
MKKKLLSSILLVILASLIPLKKAFSQEEQTVAANDISEDELLPNYQYEYIPDFTYAEIDKRVKAMNMEMSFELNDQVFSFIR